jgi:Spy/CpxP family protein refolding chaperone
MIRHAAISLLGAVTLALAATPLHAEGPGGDMKARQQEREARQEQMKKDMRQIEDRQRQENRDMEDRHHKERKALHEKHEQERDALRQKMSPK